MEHWLNGAAFIFIPSSVIHHNGLHAMPLPIHQWTCGHLRNCYISGLGSYGGHSVLACHTERNEKYFLKQWKYYIICRSICVWLGTGHKSSSSSDFAILPIFLTGLTGQFTWLTGLTGQLTYDASQMDYEGCTCR